MDRRSSQARALLFVDSPLGRTTLALLQASTGYARAAIVPPPTTRIVGTMGGEQLSVLVIGENGARAAVIEAALHDAGHADVTVARTSQQIAQQISQTAPDVVVIDLGTPDRERLEHFLTLSRALQKPVAMFVDSSDAEATAAAIEAGISAYVVDGLRKDRVKPILDMAVLRFEAESRLKRELEAARSALDDRKLVDQAKTMLIRERNLSESEAHALLRKTAMDQNRRIADVAQSIVATQASNF